MNLKMRSNMLRFFLCCMNYVEKINTLPFLLSAEHSMFLWSDLTAHLSPDNYVRTTGALTPPAYWEREVHVLIGEKLCASTKKVLALHTAVIILLIYPTA